MKSKARTECICGKPIPVVRMNEVKEFERTLKLGIANGITKGRYELAHELEYEIGMALHKISQEQTFMKENGYGGSGDLEVAISCLERAKKQIKKELGKQIKNG